MIFAKTTRAVVTNAASPQTTKPDDAQVIQFDEYADSKRVAGQVQNIYARVRGFDALAADVADVSVALTAWVRANETAADVLPVWLKIGSKQAAILKDVLVTFKLPGGVDGPAVFLQVEDATGTNLDHLEIWMACGGAATP